MRVFGSANNRTPHFTHAAYTSEVGSGEAEHETTVQRAVGEKIIVTSIALVHEGLHCENDLNIFSIGGSIALTNSGLPFLRSVR